MRAGDVHEDHLRRHHRAVAGGVVGPGVLVGVVAKIDDELVVANLDGDLVDSAAVLLLGERESSLGQRGDRPPRDLLAVVHEVLERNGERLEAVACRPDRAAAALQPRTAAIAGPHVTPQIVGKPAVDLDDLHHRPDRLAG